MIDLGTLPVGSYSYAVDINDRGQVAGMAYTDVSQYHAFPWQDGSMIDLGTAGGTLSESQMINYHGQVVGHSHNAAKWYHATLWTPQH